MPNQRLAARVGSCEAARQQRPAGLAAGPACAPDSAATGAGKAWKQGNRRGSTCRAGTKLPVSRTSGPKRDQDLVGQIISLSAVPTGVMSACTAEAGHFLVNEIIAGIIALELAVGVILVTVIIFGSTESCNRVFRLLRWIRDKEEPPTPRP